MTICKKCTLPEFPPDVSLDLNGVCNFCLEYEKSKFKKKKVFLETDFIRIIEKYRGRTQYDCLIMCSGGKDSTSALYFTKKKYKLNPLVFTFDHGFANPAALENIQSATKKLNIDWIYYKTTFPQDLFKKLIETKSHAPLCSICSLWYMEMVYDFSSRFGIDLIIGGWTKGQMNICKEDNLIDNSFPSVTKEVTDFIENSLRKIPKYKNFPKNMNEVLRKNKNKKILSPHWFLDIDKDEYLELIKKELDWKATNPSYPKNSSNCLINFIGVLLSNKYYGFSTYDIEMSQLIREGRLTRREALELLEVNFDKDLIGNILKDLTLTGNVNVNEISLNNERIKN